MSEFAMRRRVVQWLQRQPDMALRQAVFALQLMYRPDHLAMLFHMAERATITHH